MPPRGADKDKENDELWDTRVSSLTLTSFRPSFFLVELI